MGDEDEGGDPLALAEAYLDRARAGSPVSRGRAPHTDDPRARIEGMLRRVRRIDRAADALLPRAGREAQELRAALPAERAAALVAIGAEIARWTALGGTVQFQREPPAAPAAPPFPTERVVTGDAQPPPTPDPLSAPRPTRRLADAAPPAEPLTDAPPIPEPGDPPERLGDELAWLEREVGATRAWFAEPAARQHAIVSHLAARLRWFQDLTGDRDLRARIDALFPKLSSFAKRAQPGFVFGLSRDHRANTGSWKYDAERWAERWRSLGPPADQPPADEAG